MEEPAHLSPPPPVTRVRPALLAGAALALLLGMVGVAIYLANHQASSPVQKTPAEATFTAPDPNVPPALLRTPVPSSGGLSSERAATLAYLAQLGENRGALGASESPGGRSFSFSAPPPAEDGENPYDLSAASPESEPATSSRWVLPAALAAPQETPLSRALRAPLDPQPLAPGPSPGETSLAELLSPSGAKREDRALTPPLPPPAVLFDAKTVRLGLGAGGAAGAPPAGPSPTSAASSPFAALEVHPHRLIGEAPAPLSLAPGTLLPAALLTTVDSTVPGPIVAQLTLDVFDSATLTHRLLPRGTRLVGRYDAANFGQGRLVVLWESLGLPDGRLFALPPLPGAAADGSAGLRGAVDHHLARTLGSALLLSLISAGSQLSQPDQGGSVLLQPTTRQVIAGAVGQELTQVSADLLRRVGNLAPTFRIPSGTAFNVVLTRPLVLSSN